MPSQVRLNKAVLFMLNYDKSIFFKKESAIIFFGTTDQQRGDDVNSVQLISTGF